MIGAQGALERGQRVREIRARRIVVVFRKTQFADRDPRSQYIGVIRFQGCLHDVQRAFQVTARLRMSPLLDRDFCQTGQGRAKIDVIRSEGLFEDCQGLPECVASTRIRSDLQQCEAVAAQRHGKVVTVGSPRRFLQGHGPAIVPDRILIEPQRPARHREAEQGVAQIRMFRSQVRLPDRKLALVDFSRGRVVAELPGNEPEVVHLTNDADVVRTERRLANRE